MSFDGRWRIESFQELHNIYIVEKNVQSSVGAQVPHKADTKLRPRSSDTCVEVHWIFGVPLDDDSDDGKIVLFRNKKKQRPISTPLHTCMYNTFGKR